MHDFTFVKTPIGLLKIIGEDTALIGIQFISHLPNQSMQNKTAPHVMACKKIIKQLDQYFKKPTFQFDLPLTLHVTPFQKKVLKVLQKIPAGTTKTYGELAKVLKTSPRAIGQACRKNPIPIVIPCHRVVSKTGLGGFAGKQAGRLLAIKKQLLAYESVV